MCMCVVRTRVVCVLCVHQVGEGEGAKGENRLSRACGVFCLNHIYDPQQSPFLLYLLTVLCLHLAPADHFYSPSYGLIAVTSRHMDSGLLPENVTSLLKPDLMFQQYKSAAKLEDTEENNKHTRKANTEMQTYFQSHYYLLCLSVALSFLSHPLSNEDVGRFLLHYP